MNQTSAPCSRDTLIQPLIEWSVPASRAKMSEASKIHREFCPAINTGSFSPLKTLQCSSDILMRDHSIQKVNSWFWCIGSGFSFEIWGGFTRIALMLSVEATVGAFKDLYRASKGVFHCSSGLLHFELCLPLYFRHKLWGFLEGISQRFC